MFPKEKPRGLSLENLKALGLLEKGREDEEVYQKPSNSA